MPSPAFYATDFKVFDEQGFRARMGAIRERIRPKLEAVGHSLTPAVSRATGGDAYAHVAKHARPRMIGEQPLHDMAPDEPRAPRHHIDVRHARIVSPTLEGTGQARSGRPRQCARVAAPSPAPARRYSSRGGAKMSSTTQRTPSARPPCGTFGGVCQKSPAFT